MSQKGKIALVNRRYLRIKVFQALYTYYRTENADLQKIERALFEGINDLYNLYLYLVKLISETEVVAREIQDANRNKKLPTQDDLNPNQKFVNNRVFAALKHNRQLNQLLELRKINWTEEHDDLRRIFKQFKTDEVYLLYMAREEDNLQVDRDILVHLFKEHLGINEVLHAVLEEHSIYWQDDLPVAALTLIKTLQSVPSNTNEESKLLADLYKNKDEDQRFTKELLRKTIDFGDEYGLLIATKAENWETERIALLDMILMKMGLTELEHFPEIPVKVTLNEYIELAKTYSTPKSRVFINGVLDKLVADFKRNGRIEKKGRGLME